MVAAGFLPRPQSNQALAGDGRGGAIDRLMVIEWLGRIRSPVAHGGETRRAGVPIGNAVCRGVREVEVAGRTARPDEKVFDLGPSAERIEIDVFQRVQEFQLLGIADHDPCEAPRPRAERTVALLGRRAAIVAVVGVEQAFMRDTTADVVDVASVAIEDGIDGRRAAVVHEPLEQRDRLIVLAHQAMPELVAHRECSQRADRVAKERMRTVERVDVTVPVGRPRPAGRLHGAAHLERQFAEIEKMLIPMNAAFEHQPADVAIGADVVEPVVMHADMRDMRRHEVDRALQPEIEKRPIAGGVKLQEQRAELKALGPFGPPTGGVFALDREHGRAVTGFPGAFERFEHLGRARPHPLDGGEEILWSEFPIDQHAA